jgi:hypothetical protein
MTGFIVSIFLFRNRVSPKEAFEGLEPGEGKLSRPVLRGLGSRKAAWPLDSIGATRSPGMNSQELINLFATPEENCAGSAKMQGHRLQQCFDPVPSNLHTDTN